MCKKVCKRKLLEYLLCKVFLLSENCVHGNLSVFIKYQFLFLFVSIFMRAAYGFINLRYVITMLHIFLLLLIIS